MLDTLMFDTNLSNWAGADMGKLPDKKKQLNYEVVMQEGFTIKTW